MPNRVYFSYCPCGTVDKIDQNYANHSPNLYAICDNTNDTISINVMKPTSTRLNFVKITWEINQLFCVLVLISSSTL
jgi:hypothetical protein